LHGAVEYPAAVGLDLFYGLVNIVDLGLEEPKRRARNLLGLVHHAA
jgi:hypothetical protein